MNFTQEGGYRMNTVTYSVKLLAEYRVDIRIMHTFLVVFSLDGSIVHVLYSLHCEVVTYRTQ